MTFEEWVRKYEDAHGDRIVLLDFAREAWHAALAEQEVVGGGIVSSSNDLPFNNGIVYFSDTVDLRGQRVKVVRVIPLAPGEYGP